MEPRSLTVSRRAVRRLFVRQQLLAGGRRPPATKESILAVVRDLGFVQWDPITIVAPSHLLSFRARLTGFRPADLESLLWKEKKLFEHWTPIASLVLLEDYPLFYSLMRRYPASMSRSWGIQGRKAKQFLDRHTDLRRYVLRELKHGPRRLGEFSEHRRTKGAADDWNDASDVSLMLFHLSMTGEVMVVGHEGNQNLWGLSRDFLPGRVERTELPQEELERLTTQRALHALGVATAREILTYFIRGRYQDLPRTLARLEAEAIVRRVTIEGESSRQSSFILERDAPVLESLEAEDQPPRMSLLPPFDNFLYNQDRGIRLFGFDYVREQFLPAAKRRYGTYVLPIVWGDRVIGRIDPRLDKERGVLTVNAVHAEPEAPGDRAVARELAEEISRLAEFVGASSVSYSGKVPSGWKNALR